MPRSLLSVERLGSAQPSWRAWLNRLAVKDTSAGKEPTWVSTVIPGAPPVSIPNHPGELNRFTVKGILTQLEADLDLYDVMEGDDDE